MNGIRWISRCAILFLSIVGLPISVHSQDDPFGIDPTAVEGLSGEPTPVAGETAQDEKSVLAGEARAPAAANGDFCQCVGQTNPSAVEKIERALKMPLSQNGLDFSDTPLVEVVNVLQTDYGIPIQLDAPALDEIGLAAEEAVTVNLHNISLESALRLMLKRLQLTYVIRDEVLIITTPEEAEAQLLTCVYDIRDIVHDPNDKTVRPLIDTILSCVATETWAKNGGGEAEIRMLEPGLLVISQIQPIHDEVRDLIKTIRDMSGNQPAVADPVALEKSTDAEKVITRSYMLQLNRSNDVNTMRSQVRELIMQSLPDKTWNGRLEDGQPIVLSVFHDRVVVRHKQSVQDEVRALLAESGIATLSPTRGEEMASGGFGGGGTGGGGGGFFAPDPAVQE